MILSDMKKVLVISYSFPPVGGAGVQRPVKFVKYLRDYGWEPVVLSVANPSVPVKDYSLEKDIPVGVHVYRAKTFEPSYKVKQGFKGGGALVSLKKMAKRLLSPLLLPDLQVLWWPGLIRVLFVAIKKEQPVCLFVSAPPFSSFIPVVVVGIFLRIPVVLDYRDEWTFSRKTLENSSKHWPAVWLDGVLERFVISQCTAFTAANKSYVDSLVDAYPRAAYGKGYVITNGYDDDDFQVPKKTRVSNQDNKKINLIYTGTVWAATSFQPFILALEILLRARPELLEIITLKIVGRVVGPEITYLETRPVSTMIELCGYLDHEKVIEELGSADVLLLTLSDLPGTEKIITGKVFEYMASGKHIFAIVPDGETKTLLCENYDNVTISHPANVQSILDGILEIVDNIADLRLKRGGDTSQFLRRNLTEKLAGIFNLVGQK